MPACCQQTNPFSPQDLNFALYRCREEEGADRGQDVYGVPGIGPFNYAGLQGVVSVLDGMRRDKDLGHPLAKNLRDGDWLMDAVVGRMRDRTGTREVDREEWFQSKVTLVN